jgi:hypothetical protein
MMRRRWPKAIIATIEAIVLLEIAATIVEVLVAPPPVILLVQLADNLLSDALQILFIAIHNSRVQLLRLVRCFIICAHMRMRQNGLVHAKHSERESERDLCKATCERRRKKFKVPLARALAYLFFSQQSHRPPPHRRPSRSGELENSFAVFVMEN